MALKTFCVVSVLIIVLAAGIQLDVLGLNGTFVALMHQYLGDIFSCCPYHVAQNLLAKIGLSTSSRDVPEGMGYSIGGIPIVRYEKDYLFTKDELSQYKGEEDSLGLYIGILGRVYDVGQGAQHYGPGGAYHFFSGCDGTKAFMTGAFNEEGLIDEVTGLKNAQMLELENWIKFYEETYIYKGKVTGNFYDENGVPTAALHEAMNLINQAHQKKKMDDEVKRKFPSCNSARTSAGGSVSCSNKSGGIKRDWVGVPRKYHTPGSSVTRCVCVRTEGAPYDHPDSDLNRGELDNPHLEEYKGCDPTSDTCQIL